MKQITKAERAGYMAGITVKIAIAIVALAGWVQCLIAFIHCDFNPSYKAEIIYGIGTVTGLGSILGWFHFGT